MSLDINTRILIPDVPGEGLEVSHNGSLKTGWRPSDSRSFDNTIEKCNPARGLKAERIDGAWYWVTGCKVCLGEKNSWMNYHVCDEHDVCSGCGVDRKAAPRSQKHNAVYGHPDGWRCHSCHKSERIAAAMEALRKAAEDEPDTDCTDSVVCPHCGESYDPQEGPDSAAGLQTCGVCNGQYEVSYDVSVTYDTRIVGPRITPETYQFKEL